MYPPAPVKNRFGVAFGVDAGYYRGMGVTITSVVENNRGLDFIFHVFAFSITNDSRDKLAKLEKQLRRHRKTPPARYRHA
ncbi:glycosyltransferase [Cupriavidus basilensis]